ncbi:hypothetical protein ONS95_012022 [Cadophora gregata]|uniref:uncharacterized protein n=1 Tax=Cadophora gregata TaxID=51156 RepID=UPI0026DB8044|nr:uncharacterized protein ONS95_012022 [Cadophora gregata]KAK0117693.1 hypothetical protein ONS95_012022 [Cadophora gregata]KAK0122743.1 hypothetical protein ONS96_009778 [Cadophora gregata f. sp. sojae]
MAAQKDMQDLLRLLTTGRNKIPMLAAMQRVKALQSANLRSISDIAAIDLPALTTALSSDEKTAKSLLAACKAYLKSGSSTPGKRSAADTLSPTNGPSKRTKSAYELSQEPQTPAELEASLSLPQPSADEEAISKCVVVTNRAPLVLAFAVQLLKYTMPEQPLSGMLSLAQAVVSANSRSKAVSIGIEKGKGAEEEGWGMGQPKVRILGREISVLKRSGYEWKEEQEKVSDPAGEVGEQSTAGSEQTLKEEPNSGAVGLEGGSQAATSNGWTVSSPVTVKSSTFVARSITITSPADATSALQTLLSENKDLREASHNISAWRVQGSHGILESSNDDGESGGGRHILGLLQADNIVGVLLVVTRWYGGILLGTDRWRLMSMVSRDALSQRLRIAGVVGQDALWGLDLEGMKKANSSVTGSGMPIHRPEGARAYILRAFGSPEAEGGNRKKKSGVAIDREREENLGLLLGALDMLFKSWDGHVSREELDRKAWGWYVQVRPDVAGGVAGWGGKGEVKLSDILKLRRKD